MAEHTGIEWADHTFNPWIGCTALSPACEHCYAETLVKRWGGDFATRRRTSEANWKLPLAWNRKACVSGVRRKVFCASLSDIFDNQVPVEWFLDTLDVIRKTTSLIWLLLTKRPQNIMKRLQEAFNIATSALRDWISAWLKGKAPENVWLGTTAENQEEANRRIPHLLAATAELHFLSCEPLLEPVDLERISFPKACECEDAAPTLNALNGTAFCPGCCEGAERLNIATIKWVISGGESGHGARITHPGCFRSLRDQCASAGTAYFHKQNGEWASDSFLSAMLAEEEESEQFVKNKQRHSFDDGTVVWRIGKRRAGSLLDGVEHKEFPA